MNSLHPNAFFQLDSFLHATLFNNCSYPWEALAKIIDYLSSQHPGLDGVEIQKGAYLINPEQIFIGSGSVVEPGAYIKGPCYIGKNCSVRHGAYIRGGVITGDDCVIGHATEIKNSILLNGAKAAHFAYVGDSILGSGVNLGAGTRLANLRLDGREIFLRLERERLNTKRRKLGAILGDGCQTGCNAVCNPGTVAFPRTLFHPSSSSSGLLGTFSGAKN